MEKQAVTIIERDCRHKKKNLIEIISSALPVSTKTKILIKDLKREMTKRGTLVARYDNILSRGDNAPLKFAREKIFNVYWKETPDTFSH